MNRARAADMEYRIDVAIRRTTIRAAKRAKALGVPIAVWQDGQVVHIPPEEIEVDESLLAELDAEAVRLGRPPFYPG